MAAFEAFLLVMLAVIGAVVASRQPRNTIGWIFCVIPLSLGLLVFTSTPSGPPLGEEAPAGQPNWSRGLGWVWVPAMIPMLTLFPLLFPTGRPLTPRWRPVVWMAIATLILSAFSEAFKPGRFDDVSRRQSVRWRPADQLGEPVVGLMMIAMALASFASLVLRFRRSHGVERQQLKWVTSGGGRFHHHLPPAIRRSRDLGFTTLLVGLVISPPPSRWPCSATGSMTSTSSSTAPSSMAP